jgi:general secretion pathway protein K
MMRPTRPRARRQRGVAVVTALLLTTLAISIVASLFWQQQVEVRSMENQRLHLQTRWILRGAIDWATLVLFQDAMDHPRYTSLDQVWATPLAETRLDQYIERERVEGENFNATLSGNITDACSRYNLFNLAQEYRNINGDQVDVFKRLLSNLQMDPSLAQRVASLVAFSIPQQALPSGISNNGGGNADGSSGATGGVNGAVNGSGNANANGTVNGGTGSGTGSTSGTGNIQQANGVTGVPMRLLQVDDLLAVPGFTPAMVERLRPFVIVLPAITPVNANTAPAEVLSAAAGISLSAANTLIVRRKQAPFADPAILKTEIGSQANGTILPNTLDVKSEWFLVDSRIRLDRAALDAEALVYRPLNLMASGGPAVKWVRQY